MGCLLPGACSGGCLLGGAPPTATAAGGTHPTGMHSCLSLNSLRMKRPLHLHTHTSLKVKIFMLNLAQPSIIPRGQITVVKLINNITHFFTHYSLSPLPSTPLLIPPKKPQQGSPAAFNTQVVLPHEVSSFREFSAIQMMYCLYSDTVKARVVNDNYASFPAHHSLSLLTFCNGGQRRPGFVHIVVSLICHSSFVVSFFVT